MHSLSHLGQTRSAQHPNHLLLTADTFVRTTLPGMKACAAIVHAGPTMGAAFTQFAYLPEGTWHRVVAAKASRAAVIEKAYQVLKGIQPPAALVSSEDAISSHPLNDDPDLQVKCLLPDEMSFDFAVNTMVYQPGAALGQVEMHVMEHGLVMLEGGGIYRLGDSWYPVIAGDFIWMGPWCPQWFGAIGKVPAKYLIYKDWNRHSLSSAR